MKRATGKSNLDIVQSYLNNDRPFVSVGYAGEKNKYRKENEEWIDKNNIRWKRKNGKNIKLTKTQSDIIRETMGIQKCSGCGLEMKWGNKFDKLFFSKTGLCQDCLIDYETKLRIVGIYPIYEQNKLLSNQIGFLKDARTKLEETINFLEKEDTTIEVLCNSEGFREKFHGTNKEQLLKEATEDLRKIQEYLTLSETQIKPIKKELKSKLKEFKLNNINV